jgi:hypothetical protein
MVPRAARARLRRLLARAQGRRPFPRWPIESTLHDFYAFLFDLLADLAGTRPPVIAPWPDDYRVGAHPHARRRDLERLRRHPSGAAFRARARLSFVLKLHPAQVSGRRRARPATCSRMASKSASTSRSRQPRFRVVAHLLRTAPAHPGVREKVERRRLSVARNAPRVGIDASPRLDFLSTRRPSAASYGLSNSRSAHSVQ